MNHTTRLWRRGWLLAGAMVFGLNTEAGAPDARQEANGAENKVFTQSYQVRDLPNGLRVIVVPTDYPDVISVQIPVQTGSRNEVEPGKSGFARFFEHMMFRDTKSYSKVEMELLQNIILEHFP